MTAKEKVIGLILIIVGAIPFLVQMKLFSDPKLVPYLTPGGIVYQVIIIILGILLLLEFRRRYERRRLGI
jgi:hypothetical protein